MQVQGSTRRTASHPDDHEPTTLTPRGMAAPPPPRLARRPEGDPARPATIRIEANLRPSLPPRRQPDIDHNAGRPQAANVAAKPNERLQGLVLSQGLLLNAFVLLLVFGWNAPLPARGYLLGAFALGGIAVAVLIHFALHAARSRTARESRRQTGGAARLSVWFSRLAVRALPAALVTAWIAMGIYALALPPTASAFQEPRVNATGTTGGDRPAVRTRGKPQSGAAIPTKENTPAQSARRALFTW